MPAYLFEGKKPCFPKKERFWIPPNAQIIGDVEIHEDVSVWFGATLRGDVERIQINAGSNIQDNCVLHTDEGFPLNVGKGCTIGHNVILHGCSIGNGALIGMGAIIMNGAAIGQNCLVGAGALVTEGKTFPDGTLIMGNPARVTRPLDLQTIAALKSASQSYIHRWKRYLSGLSDAGF